MKLEFVTQLRMKTLQKMPMMALIRHLKVSLLVLSGKTQDIMPLEFHLMKYLYIKAARYIIVLFLAVFLWVQVDCLGNSDQLMCQINNFLLVVYFSIFSVYPLFELFL